MGNQITKKARRKRQLRGMRQNNFHGADWCIRLLQIYHKNRRKKYEQGKKKEN